MILLITVNYNNAELTNYMITTIKSKNVKIIIVDNNSSDKGKLQKGDNIELILLNNNIGYFPAINIALNRANVSLYDYIIICNNDLVFNSDFFEILENKSYDENIFAICPRILDLDGIDQNPMLDKKISKIKFFFYDLYYKNYLIGQCMYKIWRAIKPKPKDVDLSPRHIFMGYGAIYVLQKTFFMANKYLLAPPFLMFEETFLAHQIYSSNGIEFYDSSLVVHHRDHSSCSKIPQRKMYNICKESYPFFRKKIFDLPVLT